MLKLITIIIVLCLSSGALSQDTFLGYHLRHLETVDTKIAAEKTNVGCFWINGFDVYDLSRLTKKEDYTLKVATGTITFNFCKNIETDCAGGTTPIIINYPLGAGCKKLAGDITAKQNGYKISEIIKDNETVGLKLDYAPGEKCSLSVVNSLYQVTFEFTCDPDAKSDDLLVFTQLDSALNANEYKFSTKTNAACTLVNYYLVSSFLDKYKWVATLIISGLGIFLCFLGTYFIKATMFIVCTFGVPFTLLFVFLSFTNPSGDWVVWLILSIGLVVGIALGFIVNKFFQFFAGILGGCLGYVVGLLIYNMVLQYIPVGASWAYWLTIIGSIILFAILAYCFVKFIIIISTSVIGSYMIIRGASLLIGGFPNESQVLDLINQQEWEQLADLTTGWVYAYLAGLGVFAIGGAILQFYLTKNKTDEDFRYVRIKN